MSNQQPEKIERLIERSSLGAKDARRARARVPLSTGQAVARSAAAGRFVARAPAPRRSQG